MHRTTYTNADAVSNRYNCSLNPAPAAPPVNNYWRERYSPSKMDEGVRDDKRDKSTETLLH